jgi:hypothetical protein
VTINEFFGAVRSWVGSWARLSTKELGLHHRDGVLWNWHFGRDYQVKYIPFKKKKLNYYLEEQRFGFLNDLVTKMKATYLIMLPLRNWHMKMILTEQRRPCTRKVQNGIKKKTSLDKLQPFLHYDFPTIGWRRVKKDKTINIAKWNLLGVFR